MYEEANEITRFIDNNFVLKEKGSYYTDNILTISEEYCNEKYIGKFAKAIALKVSQMIRDGEIVRINKLSLDISAITIVINGSNGKVYLGFSGSKSNPTRNLNNTNELINNRIQSVIRWAATNNDDRIPLEVIMKLL